MLLWSVNSYLASFRSTPFHMTPFLAPAPEGPFVFTSPHSPAVACFPAPVGLRLAVLGTCGGFLGTGRYGYFSAGVPGVFAFPVRRG